MGRVSDRAIAFIALIISVLALVPGVFQVYEFFELRKQNLQVHQHMLSVSSELGPQDGNLYLDGSVVIVNSSERALTLDSFFCRVYSANLVHRRDHLCGLVIEGSIFPKRLDPGEAADFEYRMKVALPGSIRHIADKVVELDPEISSLEFSKILYLWFQSDPLSEIEVSGNIELFYDTLKDNFESGWEIAPGIMGGTAPAGNYMDGDFDRFYLRKRDSVELGDPPATGELKLSFFTSTIRNGPRPLGDYDFKFY